MIGGSLIRRRPISPIQFLALLQLKQGPKYGYEMLKGIRNEFNGLWSIETGTFYPALKSLEKRDFIRTEMKDDTTYYSITEKGNLMFITFGENITKQFEISEKFFDTALKWLPKTFIEIIFNLFSKQIKRRQGLIQRFPVFLQNIPQEKKVVFLEDVMQRMKKDLEFLENYYEEVKNSE